MSYFFKHFKNFCKFSSILIYFLSKTAAVFLLFFVFFFTTGHGKRRGPSGLRCQHGGSQTSCIQYIPFTIWPATCIVRINDHLGLIYGNKYSNHTDTSSSVKMSTGNRLTVWCPISGFSGRFVALQCYIQPDIAYFSYLLKFLKKDQESQDIQTKTLFQQNKTAKNIM